MSASETAGHADRSHSSVVGGSNAERRLNCPGSYKLEQKVPDAMKNKSSSFADEGTALHEAMEYILRHNLASAAEVSGMEFNGYVMTADLIDEALQPALNFFDDLSDRLVEEDGDFEVLLEQRVQVPGIPEAFGTCDIIGRTPKRSVIVDWKFGVGKAVSATYTDEGGSSRPNSQLAFYARGGMYSVPNYFTSDDADHPVELYIVQPRSRSNVEGGPIHSVHGSSLRELEQFRMQLVRAIAEAVGDNPSTKPGSWCTFAACKAVCPHHTGALLDMAKLGKAKPKAEELQAVLPDLLDVAELAEEMIATLRQYAHNFMEAGHAVPGWKLVDKRATRKWVDAKEAEETLRGAGLSKDDLFGAPELRSPAQIEKVLKKMKLSLPEDLVQAVSSGMTMAREGDKRPDITPIASRFGALAKRLAAL